MKIFDCGIFEFLPWTGYHSFFRHTSGNRNDTELRKMNVEHCSFLHYTSMKRKMTSIFAKLIKARNFIFWKTEKKKKLVNCWKLRRNRIWLPLVRNLSSVYIISWKLAVSKDLIPETFAFEKTWEMLTLCMYTLLLHWWIVFRVLEICSSWLPLRTVPNILGTT